MQAPSLAGGAHIPTSRDVCGQGKQSRNAVDGQKRIILQVIKPQNEAEVARNLLFRFRGFSQEPPQNPTTGSALPAPPDYSHPANPHYAPHGGASRGRRKDGLSSGDLSKEGAPGDPYNKKGDVCGQGKTMQTSA